MSSGKIGSQGSTRDRLVDAALQLFGERGFEAVGAREIATTAGTQLSAIPYHFGTKEALYRAALEHVRISFARTIKPVIENVELAKYETPAGALEGLKRLQASLLQAIAVEPEAEAWAKLLIREHLDPGKNFDVVYDSAARSAVDLMAILISRSSGRAPDDESVILESFAYVGEVLVFRILRAAIVKRLNWDSIGPVEAKRICDTLSQLREYNLGSSA